MIMPRGQQLLLPVRPLFIWSSLISALAVNMLLNMGLVGRAAWVPDFLALTLLFWTVHQPLKVGIGAAFFLGLAMDVHQGALLGQRRRRPGHQLLRGGLDQRRRAQVDRR